MLFPLPVVLQYLGFESAATDHFHTSLGFPPAESRSALRRREASPVAGSAEPRPAGKHSSYSGCRRDGHQPCSTAATRPSPRALPAPAASSRRQARHRPVHLLHGHHLHVLPSGQRERARGRSPLGPLRSHDTLLCLTAGSLPHRAPNALRPRRQPAPGQRSGLPQPPQGLLAAQPRPVPTQPGSGGPLPRPGHAQALRGGLHAAAAEKAAHGRGTHSHGAASAAHLPGGGQDGLCRARRRRLLPFCGVGPGEEGAPPARGIPESQGRRVQRGGGGNDVAQWTGKGE